MLYTRLTSTCFENLAFLLKYSYAVCSATNFHLHIVKVKVKECFMVFKQLVSFQSSSWPVSQPPCDIGIFVCLSWPPEQSLRSKQFWKRRAVLRNWFQSQLGSKFIQDCGTTIRTKNSVEYNLKMDGKTIFTKRSHLFKDICQSHIWQGSNSYESNKKTTQLNKWQRFWVGILLRIWVNT